MLLPDELELATMAQPGLSMRPMLSILIAMAAVGCVAMTQAAEPVPPAGGRFQASAVALAVTVRVGNAIGRGDVAGMRRAGMVGISTALVTQSVPAMLMLLLPVQIAALYTSDPALIAGASALLMLAALFQLSDGVQVAAMGALRGLKDTRVPMFIAAFSYWGVGMPSGWAFAFHGGFGVAGMWIGLIVGLTCAAVLLALRFHLRTRQPMAMAVAA